MADRPSSSQRPVSAQSRTAWGADGYDNPAGPRSDSRMSYGQDGDDLAPGALEYEESVQVDTRQPMSVQDSESGFWFKFKRGLRCKLNSFIVCSML